MKFIHVAQQYINFFYLVGQCSYPLKRMLHLGEKSETLINRINYKIPLIIVNSIILILCGIAIAKLSNKKFIGESINTLMLFFILCQILRLLTILYQCCFYANDLGDCIQMFRSIEFCFKRNLNSAISYRSFQKKFRIKAAVMFFGYTQQVLFYCIFVHNEHNLRSFVDFTLRILLFPSSAAVLQIIFYTDLLWFNLNHLNSIIDRDIEHFTKSPINIFVLAEQSYDKMARENLKKYKFVHYRLWQASQLINTCFGWSMIPLLLQGFIDIVFCTYWQIHLVYMEFSSISFGKFDT